MTPEDGRGIRDHKFGSFMVIPARSEEFLPAIRGVQTQDRKQFRDEPSSYTRR